MVKPDPWSHLFFFSLDHPYSEITVRNFIFRFLLKKRCVVVLLQCCIDKQRGFFFSTNKLVELFLWSKKDFAGLTCIFMWTWTHGPGPKVRSPWAGVTSARPIDPTHTHSCRLNRWSCLLRFTEKEHQIEASSIIESVFFCTNSAWKVNFQFSFFICLLRQVFKDMNESLTC